MVSISLVVILKSRSPEKWLWLACSCISLEKKWTVLAQGKRKTSPYLMKPNSMAIVMELSVLTDFVGLAAKELKLPPHPNLRFRLHPTEAIGAGGGPKASVDLAPNAATNKMGLLVIRILKNLCSAWAHRLILFWSLASSSWFLYTELLSVDGNLFFSSSFIPLWDLNYRSYT